MKRLSLIGMLFMMVLSITAFTVSAKDPNCGTEVVVGDVIKVTVDWRAPYNQPNGAGIGMGAVVPMNSEITVGDFTCAGGITYIKMAGWDNGQDRWLPNWSGGAVNWIVIQHEGQVAPVVVPTNEPALQPTLAATPASNDAGQTASGTETLPDCVMHTEIVSASLQYVVVVNHNLNVRRTMGTGKSPLFIACVGSTFEYVDAVHSDALGYWFKIRLDGRIRYIARGADDQFSTMLVADAEATEEPTLTPTPVPEVTATVTPAPCEAALPCQLSIGAIGHNDNQFGETHVRTDSTDPDSQMDVVLTGQFQVLDGPECHESPKHDVVICWWNISFTPRGFKDNIVTGWVPEGIPDQRWLVLGPAE